MFLIPSLQIGGNERQLVYLLKGLDRKKYKPIVCCLTSEGPFTKQIVELDTEYYFLCKRSKFDSFALLKLIKIVDRSKVNIIYSFRFTANFYGRIIGLISRKKVIISERDVFTPKSILQKTFDRLLIPFFDVMIVNSRAVKDYVVKYEHLPEDKVVVVYNGIETSEYESDISNNKDERLKAELGLIPDSVVVGSICRFDKKKNIELFLKIGNEICKQYENIEFLLVGGANLPKELRYKNRIVELIKNEHPNLKIVLPGYSLNVSRELSIMDIFLQTSNREGLPNTVMEAMVMGIPVVATDVGGTNELVKDEETGFLVDVFDDDAILSRVISLIESPHLREQMGAKGRKRILRHFTNETMVRNTQNVIVKLMK